MAENCNCGVATVLPLGADVSDGEVAGGERVQNGNGSLGTSENGPFWGQALCREACVRGQLWGRSVKSSLLGKGLQRRRACWQMSSGWFGIEPHGKVDLNFLVSRFPRKILL